MKRRRGYLMWETGISLLVLIATSGSLAMLVHAISGGRGHTRSFINERLQLESTAEELLAVDFDKLDSLATQQNNQGRIQVVVTDREIGGVATKQVDLQSNRYRRLSLSVWRFSKREPRELPTVGENNSDATESIPPVIEEDIDAQ